MIESPQSFVVRQEFEKATSQNGFRRALGEADGWVRYGSTTAKGTIWLAAAGQNGPWFMALDHAGVIEELGETPADMPGPGLARFGFSQLRTLYAVLSRVYQWAASLPDAPLREFEHKVRSLPLTTETEPLAVQRIGQDIFRRSLMDYWQGRCPLTGISDPALLRASHIVPWSVCESDVQRLDVHNGLLLSALWDAAFDQGLVTFADDGEPKFSPSLSDVACRELRWSSALPLSDLQRANLAWHRLHAFRNSPMIAVTEPRENCVVQCAAALLQNVDIVDELCLLGDRSLLIAHHPYRYSTTEFQQGRPLRLDAFGAALAPKAPRVSAECGRR